MMLHSIFGFSYLLFSCLVFVVVAEVSVLKTVQIIYDKSPQVRIRGTGFDAEAKDIKLELKVPGQNPLRADKDYMITKNLDDDGLILKLLYNRRWADLTGRVPPVALVLNYVKFSNNDANLLPEPVIVAQILNTPSIQENTELILYQNASKELRINGTGFIGSKKVDLYFQPPLFKEVAYEDVTPYPLKNDEIILRLNPGNKWKDEAGKLRIIGVDSGGGPVKVNGNNGVQVADVQANPNESTLSVEATASKQFLYADEPNLLISGTGFSNVGNILRFTNGLIPRVNYTIDLNSNSSLSLRLFQGSFWRKNFEYLPAPLTLLAINKGEGFVSVGPTNSMKGKDVAMIFERPAVYSDLTKKIFKTHTHSLNLKGTGFPSSTTKFKPSLKFEPALQENIDYFIRVIDRTTLEITLMENKAWRSEAGPLYVIGVNTRGDEKGWIDYSRSKVIVAQVIEDTSSNLRGSTGNSNNTIDWIDVKDTPMKVSKVNSTVTPKVNPKVNSDIQESTQLEAFVPKQTLKESSKDIPKPQANVTFQEI